MRQEMLVRVKYKGECRLQANLYSQQYFDRLVFNVEDQYIVGQWD